MRPERRRTPLQKQLRLAVPLLFSFVLSVGALALALFLVETIDALNVLEAQALYGSAPRDPDPSRRVDNRILIIKLTKDSAARFGIKTDGLRPFRPVWGRLLTALDRANVKQALLDVQFENPSTKEFDDPLVKAIGSLKQLKVILALPYPADEEGEIKDGTVAYHFSPPFFANSISSSTLIFGSPACVTDLNDNFLGVFPVQRDLKTERPVYQVAILLVLEFFAQSPASLTLDNESNRLSTGPISWQLSDQSLMIPETTIGDQPFEEIELSDAIHRLEAGNTKFCKDRLVVIGVDDNVHDIHPTVQFGSVPGVVYQAHLVNSFMQSAAERKREISPWILWLVIGTFIFAVAIQIFRVKSIGPGSWTSGILRVSVNFAALAVLAAYTRDFFVPYVTISLSLGITIFLALLTRVVWPKILETRIPGEITEGTVLFLDLEDSTGLVQEMGAQQYAEMYRQFSMLARTCVEKYSGKVERTTGDGCIAIFSADSGKRHAAMCAKAIRRLLCSPKLPRFDGKPIGISAGMESGVMSGTFVVEGRHEQWSSSGATVNLAQRLQSSTGKLGIRVAIGPTAKRFLEEDFAMIRVDSIEMKGFEHPVEVWTFSPEP